MTYLTKQKALFTLAIRDKYIVEKTLLKIKGRQGPRKMFLHTERIGGPRGLPIVHHDKYVCDLPPNHRFPMGKFPRVLHFLIKDQVVTDKQVWTPNLASEELLACVHTKEYLHNFINGKIEEKEQRRTGFPWSEGIVQRCRYETGGTVLAAEIALQRGLACSTAGNSPRLPRLRDRVLPPQRPGRGRETLDGRVHAQEEEEGPHSGSGCASGRWHSLHFQRGARRFHLLSALWEEFSSAEAAKRP
ncbi:hypothetical protein ANANG_G00240090 [Anguilla anguilla]|uniref:Histone deacetylase domain-containing protein n=1 Tax=Anguilla anguilla TaxID=7936 RepID=A0A9D3LZ20_ANGAN|nr:hypothetical protein ANANG_G00240090 [Anguilla anguilla]